jgi:hypothetical protein
VPKPKCWLARLEGAGPCDGALRKCHLVRRQTIRREAGADYEWDDRVWVWGCGGPMGNAGHHGMLDHSRSLRIRRDQLPRGVEEFAAEVGLSWWLDREYGLLSSPGETMG